MIGSSRTWAIAGVSPTTTWASWAARADPVALYAGPSATWALNSFKGALGERVLSATVTAGLFEQSGPGWTALTPHRVGPTGIDALFIKVTSDGRPCAVMVADAKFGSAQQGITRTGLQMSGRWVRPRLLATARDYSRAANALGRRTVRVGEVPRGALAVPLPGGKQAIVAVARDGLSALDRRTLERQLRRTAAALVDSARHGRYEARILKLDIKGNEYLVELQRLDRVSGLPVGRSHAMIRGPWDRLGSGTRQLLRECVRATLADNVASDRDVDALCRRVCRDPSFFHQLRLRRRSNWLVGADRGMAGAALSAAAAVGFVEAASGIFRGHVDWVRVAKSALLAGSAAAASYWVSAQVQYHLASFTTGRMLAQALPLRSLTGSAVAGCAGLAAGLGIGAATALGAWALGLVDAREARVMGAASAAGALAAATVPAGAFAAAGAFGTAGTGAAIGGLSGAAFNSAALAWVGSVGGGGMLMGSVILTSGATLALLAAPMAVNAVVKKLNAIERRRLVEGRLELVQRQLASAR